MKTENQPGEYRPKISVVTVVYNNETHIEQCINSVLCQTYADIEFVVIDGGSSDNTNRIIRRYLERIDYYISEPDKGISDAMNKGIRAASGDYIIFLHSDDYFCNHTSLATAVSELDEECQLLFCSILFGRQLTKQSSTGLTPRMYLKNGVWHQGTLCSRQIFQRYGVFDTTLKITMDYDFFLRLYYAGVSYKLSDVELSVMRDTGISSQTDWASLRARFAEEKSIHKRQAKGTLLHLFYNFYWPAYLTYRKIRSLLA